MRATVRGLPLLLVIAAGCASDVRSGGPVPSRDGGSTGGSTSSPGSGGSNGGSGTGGYGLPGSGGSASGSGGSSAGYGGASGFGGSSGAGTGGSGANSPDAAPADAGASEDGGSDASSDASTQINCTVLLHAVSPARLVDVPAGEGSRFRIEALLVGSPLPLRPTWKWSVTMAQKPVAHAMVNGEPAMIEFATVTEGTYVVRAEVEGDGPACTPRQEQVTAIIPRPTSSFVIRALPPAGSQLATLERPLVVSGQDTIPQTLDLLPLTKYEVSAVDEFGVGLSAYFVQIAAVDASTRLQAYVNAGVMKPFQMPLQSGRHNVLIVPDPTLVAGRPPQLFVDRRPDFWSGSFSLDPGAAVTGMVRDEAGPLERVRVRLRAGELPSTVGETDAGGAYQLRARPGLFEARVIPPAGSGLPEVTLPRSTGLELKGHTDQFDFTYGPIAKVGLKVTVTRAEGTPADGVTVVLEARESELRNVGTFNVPGRGTISADGMVRATAETAGGGLATFARLPRARYRLTLVPPPDAAKDAAITTIEGVDLVTGTGAMLTRAVALGKRSRIQGQLTLPAGSTAKGLVVRAVDTAEDGIQRTVMAQADANNRFEVASDPGRVYRLYVEPPADRSLPRMLLPTTRATVQPVTIVQTPPQSVLLTGQTKNATGGVAGVVVQVFCAGAPPACVDPDTHDLTNVLPVDETVSGPNGAYTLRLRTPGP